MKRMFSQLLAIYAFATEALETVPYMTLCMFTDKQVAVIKN